LSVPTAVFGLAVRPLAFFGLTIPPLGFAVYFSPGGQSAFIAAASLSPPAAPANTEKQATPSALNLEQRQDGHASELVNAGSMY